MIVINHVCSFEYDGARLIVKKVDFLSWNILITDDMEYLFLSNKTKQTKQILESKFAAVVESKYKKRHFDEYIGPTI